MKMFVYAATTVAALAIAGVASANQGNGNGCESAGATAKNPGQWLQALKQHPALEGQNPAQIAETENTTPGWVGYQQTPNVGALIAQFCGTQAD